jgi:F-type H+-transporting ATPase subunit delta
VAELDVRYADALYNLSKDSGHIDEYMEQAVFLRGILQEEECKRIVLHPHISAEDKRAFFQKALDGKVHDELLGFLCLTVTKNREEYILPALDSFIERLDRHNRKSVAHVVSAHELDEKQLLALKNVLSQKLDKQVEIDVKIDPAVIGGLNILVDGFLVDQTVKTRMQDMRDHIMSALRASD